MIKSKNISNYSQPDFYHFGRDVVELSDYIIENNILDKKKKVADVFCGCGVLGIEVLSKSAMVPDMFFCEIQKDYEVHIQQNIKNLDPLQQEKCHYYIQSYEDFLVEHQGFDLIMANPPYFLKEEGRLGQNLKKNKCRFFIEGSYREFLQLAKNSLSLDGQLILILRSLLPAGPGIKYKVLKKGEGYLIVEVVFLNIN